MIDLKKKIYIKIYKNVFDLKMDFKKMEIFLYEKWYISYFDNLRKNIWIFSPFWFRMIYSCNTWWSASA